MTNIINYEFGIVSTLDDGTKSGVEKEEKFRMSLVGIWYTVFIEPLKKKERCFTT